MTARPVLAAALLLAGCVPIPHMRQVASELDGILTSNGMPLGNVRIRSCAGASVPQGCSTVDEATTDAQGRFHLEGRKALEAGVSLVGEPVFAYRIDVTHEGRELDWSYAGTGYAPLHIALRCELTQKLVCTHEP